ncbi:MAG: DUF167 domain-containing protein [bacterium]|nr:DUF167 domain-containing protein [bacterium]
MIRFIPDLLLRTSTSPIRCANSLSWLMHLTIKVIPQSSRLEFAGWQGDVLRIRLTKGAHDGEANGQLIEFLAKKCNVPKTSIRILHGEKQREKTIELPDSAHPFLPD